MPTFKTFLPAIVGAHAMRFKNFLLRLLFCLCLMLTTPLAEAAELLVIDAENYDDVVPAGKEVDAIYGDLILRNETVVIVIAQPKPGRNANMTVRGVAGTVIDFTRRHHGSDQLSCFYPAGGRYLFDQAEAMQATVDGEAVDVTAAKSHSGSSIALTFVGQSIAADGTTAQVTYTLSDEQAWLDYSVELINGSDQPVQLKIEDALRCDGNLFETGVEESLRLFYANDIYFGQCYGLIMDDITIAKPPAGRNILLRPQAVAQALTPAGETVRWGGKLYCSQALPAVRSWARSLESGEAIFSSQIKLQSPQGPIAHAFVEFFQQGESLGQAQTTAEGLVRADLPPGDYQLTIRSLGRPPREHEFVISGAAHADTLSLPAASRVRAQITDDNGSPIPAKVQFVGIGDTPSPDFGPDSAIDAVQNLVYCAAGVFEQPLDPGTYRVLISHGPEYDADVQEINLNPGQLLMLQSSLPRTVDTRGWISAEFHSHSSPSGDNVSHQTGRVLNLLAEHIEFGPCTEHNRIDTYEDDLLALGALGLMATCSGMELTGSPLPINHQNAFPLHRHEHHQDGGGPQTDADPVAQIERLALWDNASEKVVQINHPNIPQILGDRDLDGEPDEGFRGMLGFVDVIEVHPLEQIFSPPAPDVAPEDKRINRIFFWMQLLNLGYRTPGVVNTDAHYNFHGSGWLRNYLACATDEPADLDIKDVIHATEHGHIIMTTGPFLEVKLLAESDGQEQAFISGEDVRLTAGTAKLWVRVQCPNWFDINRVQVFANGRPLDALNFTRQSHPQLFPDATVRFEHEIELPAVEEDTHWIVATIGEGATLGPVMGPDRGQLPPIAVSNPIFVDVDGDGFKPNRDDLGVPFMLPESTSLDLPR